jgi:hypothetical protein
MHIMEFSGNCLPYTNETSPYREEKNPGKRQREGLAILLTEI